MTIGKRYRHRTDADYWRGCAERAEADLVAAREALRIGQETLETALEQRDALAEALREIAEHACGTCQPIDELGDGACWGCVAQAALDKLGERDG